MLRSLFVLLGAAFALRFIVLESLYAPDGGTVKRVLTALMAGVTLGGIEYVPHAAITGYAALATLALYLIGLVLLASERPPAATALVRTVHAGLTVPLIVCALLVGTSACSGTEIPANSNPATVGEAKASEGPTKAFGSKESLDTTALRDRALAAARVWRQPPVPPSAANLGVNPQTNFPFDENDDVECLFSLEPVGGIPKWRRPGSYRRSGSAPIACMSFVACGAAGVRRFRFPPCAVSPRPGYGASASREASTTRKSSPSSPPWSSSASRAGKSRRSKIRVGRGTSWTRSIQHEEARRARRSTR
jgi:hypothetical protein